MLPPPADVQGQPRLGRASQLPLTGGVTQHHEQEAFPAELMRGAAVCATAVAMGGMARSIAISFTPFIAPAGSASVRPAPGKPRLAGPQAIGSLRRPP